MSELLTQLQAAFGGRYTIERELGGGGMSRVFVAVDSSLGRRIVVKVLSPELAASVSVKRFEREIKVVASLQHANIVPLLSAGDVDDVPHYTMPYVEGVSLRDHLRTRGRLTVTDTVSILRDVARALVYAHEHGVVHRDVKPENVLLSGGTAVVTDFGIAKALAGARAEGRATGAASTITQAGTSIGTPAYMAPEQISAIRLSTIARMCTRSAALRTSCWPASRRSRRHPCMRSSPHISPNGPPTSARGAPMLRHRSPAW